MSAAEHELPAGAALPRISARPNAMSGEPSFSTLLRGAKRGDGRAFAELFTSLAPRVRAFAASRNVEDPDATTNEVFLRVFSAIGDFRGSESAFTGWVFQIARNRIIDEFRSSRRRVEIVPVAQPRDRTGRNVVDEWIDDQAQAETLMRLLDRLTAEQRTVVLLRVVAGLTFKEIAHATGLRTGTARTIYRRSRITLERLALEHGLVAVDETTA